MKFIEKSAAIGLAFVVAQDVVAQAPSILLTGVVRDFRASSEPGGHLDFETLQQFQEGVGPKIYCVNLVAPSLGPSGFPQLNGRWNTQTTGVNSRLLDVDFVTPNIGYAVGDAGRLLKTTNGGATWSVINTGTFVNLWGVDFLTEQRGFIARQDGRVMETSNGFATLPTPIETPAVAPGSRLWDIQFPVNDSWGYALGSGGAIFGRTSSGWVTRAIVIGRELRSMHFPRDNDHGVAVGRGGSIVITSTGFIGGSPWTVVASPGGATDLHDVHMLDNSMGFAVGSGGLIIKTVNGGASWTPCPSGVAQDFCGVHMVDANTIFAVGVAGVTRVSRDGGATWTDAVSDATGSLNATFFPLGTVGFAVGDNGAIERFGAGQLIRAPWTDSAGRPISPTLYNPALGDLPGIWGNPYFERIHSEAGFAQWWTDVPGVNLSMPLTLTLVRQADGTYLFDSATQEPYAGLGGFFPIDNQLFGNFAGLPTHNFHFTFQLQATFVYSAAAGQMLDFEGDDDVWVYFDGKQAVDIGGRHPARRQYVDLTRLGLTDGEEYTMDFFSAERQTAGSNIRIRTNILFKPSGSFTISGGWD